MGRAEGGIDRLFIQVPDNKGLLETCHCVWGWTHHSLHLVEILFFIFKKLLVFQEQSLIVAHQCGFLFGVELLVSFQMAGPAEAFLAAYAGVQLLSGVGELMELEAAGHCEAPTAYTAFVRPLASVHTHVDAEVAGLAERLFAEVAVVGALASVYTQMCFEVALAVEPFPTLATTMRFFSAVNP